MNKGPKVFISYTHVNVEIAEKLATDLRKNGVDAWLDKWEIKLGDSIIKKIFEEGQANCDVFIILLSKASVASSWVQHELDTAMVNRIEGLARVIPVVVENCIIPVSLRALRWLNITTNYENGLREVIKAIFEVHEKPPIGSPPSFVRLDVQSVNGLSKEATQIGLFMLSELDESAVREKTYQASDIARKLNFTPQETDDAIDELEERGLVKTHILLGTEPFEHDSVEPTYAFFIQFQNAGIQYDPSEDIKKVAACIVAQEEADGKTIAERTSLSHLRINRAIEYLLSYRLIEITLGNGFAPYNFFAAVATGTTRRFVKRFCC